MWWSTRRIRSTLFSGKPIYTGDFDEQASFQLVTCPFLPRGVCEQKVFKKHNEQNHLAVFTPVFSADFSVINFERAPMFSMLFPWDKFHERASGIPQSLGKLLLLLFFLIDVFFGMISADVVFVNQENVWTCMIYHGSFARISPNIFSWGCSISNERWDFGKGKGHATSCNINPDRTFNQLSMNFLK